MNLRDYGYEDVPEIDGVPELVGGSTGLSCPNCGCAETFTLKVKAVGVKKLKGGEGVGTYIGCPACPWASPMITVAV